ncbi:MAG: 1-deoxy-D-xylulose-5-phosphate reductoisomerase [Clostridia bacterium]|nr:1-deoxy-D-xylulose-5-phosphate reductoisomerase [Clostridia bacterium]
MALQIPTGLPSMMILGATGSVGLQALDVAREQNCRVTAMSANASVTEMEALVREFSPIACAMADEAAAADLRTRLRDTSVRVYAGSEGLCTMIAETEGDVVLNSIVGRAGLEPTLTALRSGRRLALANKESLVVAGDLVMAAAREAGQIILPVDSEHSAIFQCLGAGRREDVRKILLTASGGPFFGQSRDDLAKITVEQALAHPTWKMGAKITIDSATLMNKGFEVIEAVHLFDVAPEQIEVVIHRESIIHSMVEYNDNSIIAQLGVPDMRTCVRYALTYPARIAGDVGSVDWRTLGKLTFFSPDTEAFPLLALAFSCIRQGGALPAVLNAANEVAVAAFLERRLSFCGISEVVAETVSRMPHAVPMRSLEAIVAADAEARVVAGEMVSRFSEQR